jgi:hypothetical protein
MDSPNLTSSVYNLELQNQPLGLEEFTGLLDPTIASLISNQNINQKMKQVNENPVPL